MNVGLTIQPRCGAWAERIRCRPEGELLGRPLQEWREETRRQLALDTERPIIATGHQTLLWHPGILAKYLLTDALAAAHGLATANLIVDQHAGGYGEYEIPVRQADASLASQRVRLTIAPPDEPMALHDPFDPPRPPTDLPAALPSVIEGAARIHRAVSDHRHAPNAALQMAGALADLMRAWARPMPVVPASGLMDTSLGRALLAEMARDPRRCAESYNEAVASFPASGIAPLLVREDYIELPLWRIGDDRRRRHAYDGDVEPWLEGAADAPRLMPRALLMTALIRLGTCDLFVHGTGGAEYDRAMERWIKQWLGVEPSPFVVASADLRLPLGGPAPGARDVQRLVAEARRIWHAPEPPDSRHTATPGPVKGEFLAEIGRAPRRSAQRRRLFFAMHEQLAALRGVHGGRVERAQRRAREALREHADARIAARRDWAFPLYPTSMIDELAAACAEAVGGAAPVAPRTDG